MSLPVDTNTEQVGGGQSHPVEVKDGLLEVPGYPKTAKKRLLELGSQVIQNFAPINKFHIHCCGFAYYNGYPDRQVELHHYCSNLNNEVTQCVVFDSDKSDARLVAVEYIISARLFSTLDPEEQSYWHSHQADVLTGSFIVPGVPEVMDRSVMKDFISTYGKTWMLWQTDRGDQLPLGPPSLMMVKLHAIDWKADLWEKRDAREPTSSHIRQWRADIKHEPVHPNADAWTKGIVLQPVMKNLAQQQSSSADEESQKKAPMTQ